MPSLTAEQEVLLGAIRVDRAQDGRIRELMSRGLDWVALRQISLSHGVLPLLYTRLKDVGEDLLPPQEKAQLKELYLANARRNLCLTQKLLKVLHLLASQGIEALPLKGPALTVQAYGDLRSRQIADLDILIHRRDLGVVRELLTGAGYHLSPPSVEKGVDRWLSKLGMELCFAGPSGEEMDIHWGFVEGERAFSLNPQRCWRRSRLCWLNGEDVRVLSLEDTLLFHCIHGVKSGWRQLKWVADVAHLVSNHPELDWKALWADARKTGILRVLSLGLYLAEQYGGASLPPDVRAMCSDPVAQRLGDHIVNRLFSERDATGGDDPLTLLLRSRERWRDRVRCAVRTAAKQGLTASVGFAERVIVPRPPDREIVQLPKALFPLYYLIRPLRLLAKYTMISFRSLVALCQGRPSDRQIEP